jgi:hypothetical protein
MTKITQLPVASTITNNGVFVIFDEGVTKQLTWQTLRTGGLKGDTGTSGSAGPIGPRGPTGTVATIQVGSVTMVTGTNATITATTSTTSAFLTTLDFVIPFGPKGDTGTFANTIATPTELGGIKVGSGLSITEDGTLSSPEYELPIASDTLLGGVIVGEGLNVDVDGVISVVPPSPYVLPTATQVVLGGVRIGAGINVDTEGVVSVTTGAFALQAATDVILGGVKIGGGLTVTPTGTVSVLFASTSSIGGVKVGSGLDIDLAGTLSVNSATTNAELLSGTFLANNIISSNLESLGVLSSLEISGTTLLGQTLEFFTSITSATDIVTHDCSSGTIFVHTTPLDNWTANFTGFNIPPGRVGSAALIINQGVIPRIPTSVQISGATQTLRWQGNVIPTGNANKTDLINFTFIGPIGTETTVVVLASLSSYG